MLISVTSLLHDQTEPCSIRNANARFIIHKLGNQSAVRQLLQSLFFRTIEATGDTMPAESVPDPDQ